MADIRTTGALTNNFNGPDENPLSDGGAWDFVPIYDFPLRRVGNQAVDGIHPSVLSGYISFSYYTRIVVGANGDWEVWGCTTGGQLGAALETWRIGVWTGPSTGSGYIAYYGGAIGKNYAIRSYTGSRTSFSDIASGSGSYPDMMLLRRRGTDIELWASFDAGANWTLEASVTDGTHTTGSLYLTLGIEDPTNGGLAWGCFGGGRANRPQIYRWLPVEI